MLDGLYHHKDGALNQLSTTIDEVNNILAAQTTSLSTFGGSSVDEYGNRLICWTDKKVYADDPFNADTLNNWGTTTIDLKVNVYAIMLDGEGCILRNITSSNITGTLKDTQLLDHWDGTADTAAVHHIINPGSYSEASFYNLTIGGATSYPFNDEGTTPDLVAGDGIFSAVINVAELPSNGSEGGYWSTGGLSEEHLNISINVSYSNVTATQNVLFTRLSCAHSTLYGTATKSNAHSNHGSISESTQSNCVYCHHGYEHDLGAHTNMISPYSGFTGSSKSSQTYYWNTATSEGFSGSNKGTGYATSSVAYETVAPGSEYCISCHYETGTGALDLDSSTDRPSCAWDSSPLGVTCHSDTSSEGANLTGIDWRWKENEASGSRTHNHTTTTPANVSCDICHQNFHSNQLPNTSSSTDINDQCTICHSSTGPQNSEDYVHGPDTTNCKACHLDTDQVMDPHLIAEAGIPNPNCSECHDLGGQSLNLIDYDIFNNSDYVHNQTDDGKNPLNYNADIGAATRLEDRMCWACHGEDDNEDGQANFSEQPANDHPNRYNNARTCEECHQNDSSTNFGAPQNVAHSNNTDEIRTPGAPHCYDCHGTTVMYNQSHQDTDYTTSYKDTVAAHYGTGFPALEDLRGNDTYCTKYCHQNTSSPFKNIFVDLGDMQRPKHSAATTRPLNQTCVDAQCHAAEALHSSEMKKPSFEDGEFGNANCTSSTCHPGFENHSGTLNCTSCHMDNIGSNIHPIKYLQNDGVTFSKVNNTAADCNLCHKETLADAKMTEWGLSPAKVGAQRHSEDPKNGSKWNTTSEPYWTYEPQTITYATGWQANSVRGFITNFEEMTSTNDSAARISENTTEDSYVGHFPSNHEFISSSTGWSTSGTGSGAWSGTNGNPTGSLTVYTTSLGTSVDRRWNTSFNYNKSDEVAEVLLKLDSKLITATRLNTGALKVINVSIDDNSGNITEVYNRTLPNTPEPDWIESGEVSIPNPDAVFWKNGDYTLSIRTRFTTQGRPPRNPIPNVRVGYDNVYLDISEVDYKKYNFTFFINDTPSSDKYELIIGYQTQTEPANLYVLNNSVYEYKAALDSGAFTKLVVPLSEQEYNNGDITLRINDSTGPDDIDVHADYLEIQYMFVRSYRWIDNKTAHYPCEYCHEPDQHYENALGMPYYYKGNNYEGQQINDTTNWCASCHYQGYQNADKNYTDTVNAFLDHAHIVPPEITGHSVYGVNESTHPDNEYYNHSDFNLSSYNDSTCWGCHRAGLAMGTLSTEFVHHVSSGEFPASVSITEITTNKTDYSTNEMVKINITVDNSGEENITGDLNVTIRHQDETVMETATTYQDMFILSGESNSTTTLWDTTTTPPGNYIAYAQFDYLNQTRPESQTNSTAFNITGVGATVQTNKTQYRPTDTVNFTGTTYNLTSNVGDADVNISVYYPNETLFGWVNTTSDSSGNYMGLCDLALTDPIGTYAVNVQASKDGDSSINSTTFSVLDLLVTTTTDRSTYAPGTIVSITVNSTYTNLTAANNSQVNLTIKDPNSVTINETSGTIDADGFYTYQYTIPTDATEGTYSISANVTDPEGYDKSGSTTFDVVLRYASLDIDPSITVMWKEQTKIFTLTVENTGDEAISSGSVNLTSTGSNFTIQNQSSMEFTDLANESTVSFDFNVTTNASIPLVMHTLSATLSFDGLDSQKDVYILLIREPEIFVRTVTDKAVYLLDPALWVTDAPNDVWSNDGHPRNVTINAMVVDQYGRLVPNERYTDEPTVTYCAHVGHEGGTIISNGTMNKTRTGFYTMTFEVNETTGVDDYLVHVDVVGLGKEVSGATTFTVDRWGCDDCHKPGEDHGWTWGYIW